MSLRAVSNITLALVAFTVGLSCRRAEPKRVPARGVGGNAGAVPVPQEAAAGSLRAPDFAFSTGVYHLPRPNQDPGTTLARLAPQHPGLTLVTAAPNAAPSEVVVWLESPPVADYQPPANESLKYFGRGLSDEQMRALADTEAVSVLKFAGPGALALATYRQALALTEALASETGGILWDEEARLAFAPAAWAERRQGWKAVALIDELFGSKDELVHTDHDEELLAASERVRKAVLKYKPCYSRAPPVGEQLLVKAPFTTSSGGEEWMWVEVVRWEGKKIRGVLQNDPFEVPGLKAGARVEVDESSLFDYILQRADGSSEGNETGALIEKRR